MVFLFIVPVPVLSSVAKIWIKGLRTGTVCFKWQFWLSDLDYLECFGLPVP